MSYTTGRLTLSGSGIQEFYLGFKPIAIEFSVAQKYGYEDDANHFSLGASDGTRQNVQSMYSDHRGPGLTRNSNTKCVSHYERGGDGVIREVLTANNVSFISTGFKINVVRGNAQYQVTIRAFS